MRTITVTVIVLLSLSLLVHTAQAASNPPPSLLDETTVATPVSGTAIVSGWNYLKLGTQSCAAGVILDELQADAGGGVRIDSFWAASTTSLLGGQSWKEYMATDEKSRGTLIPSSALLALYSNTPFYVDLGTNACSNDRPATQQTQIQEVRTIAAVNAPAAVAPKANESIWKKITTATKRIFTWIVNAWTGGIMMVWNPVAGAIGKIMKR